MQKDSALIQELREEIANLKKQFARQEARHDKFAAAMLKGNEQIHRYLLQGVDEHIDNRERISNLEDVVFPNLSKDLRQLGKTIGPLNAGYSEGHPLDRKKKKN